MSCMYIYTSIHSRSALVPAILVTALNPKTWTSLIASPDIYIYIYIYIYMNIYIYIYIYIYT